ncbi:MAG: hypothetical protein PHI86_00750 [Candidatus Omnitrophica bacterium]|nr:hypothetical protein [Candidatus Omnitrophota bacterium]HOX54930.1 hypothetical protein [Candidatus Omnitrophota bacterium]
MKRIILLITIVTMLLVLAQNGLFAEPQKYLRAEGTSYGYEISREAKIDAAKARAREGRFLKYGEELDKIAEPTQAPAFRSADSDISAAILEDAVDVNAGGANVPGLDDIVTTVPEDADIATAADPNDDTDTGAVSNVLDKNVDKNELPNLCDTGVE